MEEVLRRILTSPYTFIPRDNLDCGSGELRNLVADGFLTEHFIEGKTLYAATFKARDMYPQYADWRKIAKEKALRELNRAVESIGSQSYDEALGYITNAIDSIQRL